ECGVGVGGAGDREHGGEPTWGGRQVALQEVHPAHAAITAAINTNTHTNTRPKTAILLRWKDSPACHPMIRNAAGITAAGRTIPSAQPHSSRAAVSSNGPSVAGIGRRISAAIPVPATVAATRNAAPTHHGATPEYAALEAVWAVVSAAKR